jgi:hypothetical protein
MKDKQPDNPEPFWQSAARWAAKQKQIDEALANWWKHCEIPLHRTDGQNDFYEPED